ncbi:MAG TPA: hypothetical protein VJS44_21180 [Pyrinomonadaceae bacterium]|nr:hypothetical protein [Pyrinomonadaceae bacterium]
MTSINFKQKLGGAILGISIIFGVGFTPATATQAQSRNDGYYQGGQDRNRDRDREDRDWGRRRRGRDWDRYGRWGGSYELRQTALNAGYNEGVKEGRKDRSKNRRFDFYGKNEFQKATKDYNSRLGDRELYRRYFQQGYENGYTDGYRGY